jgi:hypothetical protein
MTTYTISYNKDDVYWIYDDDTNAWVSSTEAEPGPVIGPISVPNGTGPGPDDLIWDDYVGSGEVATGVLHGGEFCIFNGGVASAVTVGSGGVLNNRDGLGSASDVVVESGGDAWFACPATVTSATVASGDSLYMGDSGGSASNVVVESGGDANFDCPATVISATIASGDSLYMGDSGGSASDVVVESGGEAQFECPATVISATIASGDYLYMDDSLGSASDVVVESGGYASFDCPATVNALNGWATVTRGGSMDVTGSLTGLATIADDATLQTSGAEATGSIDFTSGATGATLQIDGKAMPSAVISGFTNNDTIDLRQVAFDPNGTAILQSFGGGAQTNVLTVVENGADYFLTMDPSQSFMDDQFVLSPDGEGGTNISMRSGLDFNLSFDQRHNDLTVAFIQGVDAAAAYYEQLFSNTVTLNINVGDKEVSYLGSDGLSQGGPVNGGGESISTVYSGLSYSAVTGKLNGLPATDPFHTTFEMTSGEEKVLGLLEAGSSGLDGSVGLAADLSGNGLKEVALHEFSEVMGRISGLTTNNYTVLDLFRFLGEGVPDTATTLPTPYTSAYFSTDSGKTALAYFNATSGLDLGDWADSQVGDAFLAQSGNFNAEQFTSVDATVMSALGWDLAYIYPGSATVGDFETYLAELDAVPGGFVISDSSAAIVADLSALNADSDITALIAASGVATLSGGTVINADAFELTGAGTTLTIAENFAYAGTFSLGAGSTLSISTGDILNLTGRKSFSGTVGGGGTLDVGGSTTVNSGAALSVAKWSLGSGTTTIAESLSYASVFLAVDASSLVVNNSDTLTLTGDSTLHGAMSGGGALALGGGATTIADATALLVASWSISGAKTSATIDNNLSYAGSFSEGAGSTLSISSGDALTLSGPNSIAGTISGTGTLAITGGSNTLASGVSLTVSNLSESGAATVVTVGESLTYGGSFTQSAGSTLSISTGDILNLTGTKSFSGTVGGGGTLNVGGSTAVNSGAALSVADWTLSSGTTTIAESLSYAGALLAGSASTLDVDSNDTLTLTGVSKLHGAVSGGGALALGGGVTTLAYSAALSVASWSISGANTSATIDNNLSYAGSFNDGAGSTLSISSGDTLTLTGTNSIAGAIGGLGTLDLSGGGSTSIDSGAKISVSAWSLLGSKTSATLNENLAYAGTFGEAADDTLDLSGGSLTLTGSDTFSGGTVDGSNRLYAQGTTLITDGLTIAGTASLENQKTLTQSGGAVTVGDNAGNKAELYNASTGTYAIADDSGIGRGSSTASFIVNAGLLEKTGGAKTSTIAPALTNTGTVLVSSGVLDLQRAVTGTGAETISGASTLEFDSTVAGGQTIGFTGAGGTLDLGDPQGFSGKISGFDTVGSNDRLEIAAPWTYLRFSENAADTQGTLTFASGASQISLTLLGNYADDFIHQAGPGGSTLVTYS